MTGLWLISYIALWILFLVVAIVLISVLRNLGVIYESMAAIAPKLQPAPTNLKSGEVLPEITWQTLSGEEKPISEFRGVKTAFSIVSPTCSPCRSFLKDIAEDSKNPDPLDPTVQRRVIVSIGDVRGTSEMIRQAGLQQNIPVLVDKENAVTKVWGTTSTPTTVIVDDQLRVVRQLFGA